MAANAGTGSPCGACKFLRRKCTADCIFAPYFCSEQGPDRFAAIHKVFGASNVSKLLHHVAAAYRCEAVDTIAYEAQARIKDPVYGCVAHIFALQQQVACLQAQLMQVRAQMAQGYMDSRNLDCQHFEDMTGATSYQNYMNFNTSQQSLMEWIDHSNEVTSSHEIQSRNYQDNDDHVLFKKRISESDLGELHELAVRMMRN
ncbi:putative transcription factor AS2-LOB family [Helianthus annuus]|uniref:Putative LOB domain-containing protein n=1 Tax=Helianthus annuus TaxID=4232 RepID=A0A251VN68_HELAN|nr:LOB domain-containing protein 16 [Helianthus annuus]KAF5822014.1 putative transcription factor AS2-LOB family [Helianthus annuus]KAJ0947987.1 putative transcription factor AS2-LOB family [Helianthus annuus]